MKFKTIMVESEVAGRLKQLEKGSYNQTIKYLLEEIELTESRLELIEKRLDNLNV